MCTFCEPGGWDRKTCNICGTTKPHTVYISICIAIDIEERDFPYTETDLCKKCWEKYGIDAAIQHNKSILKYI